MTPVRHAASNHKYGAPDGWDHDAQIVDVLHVIRAEENGFPIIQSVWEPSAAEKRAIVEGKRVVLTVIGNMQPIVKLGVEV